MNLRDIQKFINTIQNQLLKGDKSSYSLEECGIMYGIYRFNRGSGKLYCMTNEQLIIARATEFYLTEISKYNKKTLKTSPYDNVTSLCERFDKVCKSLGLNLNYTVTSSNTEARVHTFVIADITHPVKTGKEMRNPHTVELSVSYKMFNIHYPMLIEDFTMAIIGIKGCAFTNTNRTISIINTLKTKICD